MLVLTRKKQESVVVGGASGWEQLLKVTVVEIRGSSVKLAFDARAEVPVHRAEVWERISAERQTSHPVQDVGRPKERPTYCD